MRRKGPRSAYSLLPFQARYRLCGMLSDGATYRAIAEDAEIRAACERIGGMLPASAVSRVKRSAEYREFVRRRAEEMESLRADRLAAGIAGELGAEDAIGDALRLELLRLLRTAAKRSPEDPKELERLVRSAAALTRERLERRLEEAEAGRKRLAARCADLESALAEARKRLAASSGGANGNAVAEALRTRFGLNDGDSGAEARR